MAIQRRRPGDLALAQQYLEDAENFDTLQWSRLELLMAAQVHMLQAMHEELSRIRRRS